MARRQDRLGITGGIILVLLGVAFLLNQFWDINVLKFWPVILIVVGIVAIKDNLDNRK